MSGAPFDLQLLNACAALLLLVSFAMLSQRRIVTLVNLLAVQGAVLCAATLLLAWRSGPVLDVVLAGDEPNRVAAGLFMISMGMTVDRQQVFAEPGQPP